MYTTDRTGSDGYVAGDYLFFRGTSVASPYAAGVAALVLSVNPALDAEGVEQVLQVGAVDLGPTGYDTVYGWGFVNANNALDCNGNGIPDLEDINSGPPHRRSPDCNANSIPDECEDCDNDGTADPCQILADPSLDCDLNGLIDVCEIAGNPNLDCNANGVLDSCDIAGGSSLDINGNGVPDECECLCLAHLNRNGAVELSDVAACNFGFVINGTSSSGKSVSGAGDVNGDGLADLIVGAPNAIGGRGNSYVVFGLVPCPWDCQAAPSGSVDVPDLLALLATWGAPGPCDFDNTNVVAVPDLLQLLANWGPCP